MASPSQYFLFVLFFLFFSFSSAGHQQQQRRHLYSTKYSAACKASRNPSKCEAALAKTHHLTSTPTPLEAIQLALWLSSQNVKIAQAKVKDVQDFASAGNNANLTNGAKVCLEVLHYSAYRINLTGKAVPNGRTKDARAWMSAALAYQFNCRSGFQKFVNGSSKVNETATFFDSLLELSSNALSMVMNYDIHGNNTASWSPPKTERDGFWEQVGAKKSDLKGGVPKNLKPNVTVCKDGSCDYRTVQQAVDAAPNNLVGNRFVMSIKAGVYEEIVRVPLEKRNVVFLGDGMGKTVITGSLNVGIPGMTTSESSTVGVAGDGFMASNLTIQNTAGSDAQQAVAFVSDSDLSVIENCEFIGNQDTLYAKTLRQYYKSSHIQGNVDFIFGNAAAFFQDCVILIAPRTSNPENGENNAVTAHGRSDPAQSTGFVFNDCVINGTKEYMTLYYSMPSVHKSFLGRPWKEYSRTVFIHCIFEALISPEGWLNWIGDFALQTLYYGEFANRGPGANTTGRAKWSNQIPAEHVSIYSVQNFIQGDEWIPASN